MERQFGRKRNFCIWKTYEVISHGIEGIAAQSIPAFYGKAEKMKEIIVTKAEAGQRFDRFLGKYMPGATSGFFINQQEC